MDWRSRVKNPTFWLGLIGVVMSPILAYMGLAYSDLTDWGTLGNVFAEFFTNPYLIGTVVVAVLGVFGVVTDPTTPGVTDKAKDDSEEAGE